MNKARLSTLKNGTCRLGKGGTTCPTIHLQEYECWPEIYNTAWIDQAEIYRTAGLNVGRGTNTSFGNSSCITFSSTPMQVKQRQSSERIKSQHCSGVKPLAYPIKQKYKQQGISLIEIIVVITILAIIAVVVMPNLSSNDVRKLDLAAEELAQAIRFARLESIRTKTPHGVVFNTSSDNAKVYRQLSFFPTYDVYHPVNKRLYTLNLKTDNATVGVSLQSYAIYYTNSSFNLQSLSFNTDGNPKFSFFGTDYMLVSAVITLEYAGKTKVINVSPMTGRVTVQ